MGGLVFWWGFSFLGFFVWLFSWVFLFCVGFLFFQDRVLLCGSGCPGTHNVDEAGLELTHLPASASQILELKVFTTYNPLIL